MVGSATKAVPSYCSYTGAACDQMFPSDTGTNVFFVYPSDPQPIAATIEKAATTLNDVNPRLHCRTWKDLDIHGQVIFCEICMAMRFASTVVADVSTLNFNLLFEIGFCMGLGVPVIPVRDTTWIANKRDFEELGILDTLGYLDFTNSEQLSTSLIKRIPAKPLTPIPQKLYLEAPLYVLKGPILTNGTAALLSTLKRSGFEYRTYDPLETPRLSLHDARRQVEGSLGVIAHLLSPSRKGYLSHNALCALLCGMAMAQQKIVAMLQEETVVQPIDYRDVVYSYQDADHVPRLLERSIRQVVQRIQAVSATPRRNKHENLLQIIDLGDTAAENEVTGLRSYFVQTGQYAQARQGHARLVVGRKGSGKTAIYYEIIDSMGTTPSRLLVDLKPEGHQFTKLRETVLTKMPKGLREHTMTAFWNYILLCEIAHRVIRDDFSFAQRDPERYHRYCDVIAAYEQHKTGEEGDFSQRLIRQISRVIETLGASDLDSIGDKITERIYGGDIRKLDDALGRYLEEKQSVWLLIDNIDKGWPTRGTTSEDILIVRSLLEASRKLQRQLEEREVEFKSLVFLRTDIHEHLVRETPDKGKDTSISLDWDDPQTFQDVVLKRVKTSVDLEGGFRDIWPQIFDSHVGVEDSFNYILARTLMRPRDLLNFLHQAIATALNRGHLKVTAQDLMQAEHAYSEDLVLNTAFEIGDTFPKYADILYAFQGCKHLLSKEEVQAVLSRAGISEDHTESAIQLLLWFGVLGIREFGNGVESYSYMVRYNMRRLEFLVNTGAASFVVHPGFRDALAIQT